MRWVTENASCNPHGHYGGSDGIKAGEPGAANASARFRELGLIFNDSHCGVDVVGRDRLRRGNGKGAWLQWGEDIKEVLNWDVASR